MSNNKILYQGRIIEVVEFSPDGKRTFEFARRAPGTRTIVKVGDKILLTREHRHEVGGYDYRLPGGKVFDTLAEYNDFLSTDPSTEDTLRIAQDGAVKELKEEVGVNVGSQDLDFLHKSVCGATVEWDLYYFAVNVSTGQLGSQELEEGEDISTVTVSVQEARTIALDASKMSEDRSAAVLLRYLEGD